MDFADQAANDALDSHPDHQSFVAAHLQSEAAAFQDLVLAPMA